jgi:hypothetical protein
MATDPTQTARDGTLGLTIVAVLVATAIVLTAAWVIWSLYA